MHGIRSSSHFKIMYLIRFHFQAKRLRHPSYFFSFSRSSKHTQMAAINVRSTLGATVT
jgi:hypothetical protein